MLKKYMSRFEDPNHPLLGPHVRGLQSCGMLQSNTGPSRTIYNLIHFAAMLFVCTQYVELWFIGADLELALRNLSVTTVSSVCTVKAVTFIAWQKDWRDIINYVSTLERSQLEKKDKITGTIIEKYTKYSRTLTYFYWILNISTVIAFILSPLMMYLSSAEQRQLMSNGTIAYPEIMSSWVPFDKKNGFGYWVVLTEHSMIGLYGAGTIAIYDTTIVVLMSFFYGQLELLVANCKRLFGENNELVSYSEAMERIKQCHYHHLSLIKYSKILNSVLSPVMFFYVIVCSLMFCASAILLTKEGTTTMQRMWVADYIWSLIAQLFFYCWHGNQVYFMSQEADRGVYESEWWRYGVRVRRSVLLLGGQLRKTILFEAGPFTTITVATFIAILQGSYSYYTLLNGMKDT